jgi:hypothetical protein
MTRGIEADTKIDIRDMEEPEGGEGETYRDDRARVELGGQDTSDRHHDGKRGSSGRQCHARQLRGVAEIVLQELRQQNGAAVENHAKDELKVTAVAKFLIPSMRKSMIGCLSSRMTKATSAMTAMMRLTVIMCEENQSFSWPLSKTYWGSLHQRR